MQYSPKLKKAMEEIKAIIKKNDVAAIVVLHTPGHSEYVNELSPSYSVAKHEGDQLRFRSKLSDYGGDKDKQLEDITSTINMLVNFRDYAGMHFAIFDQLLNQLKEGYKGVLDIQEGDPNNTSHTEQNN